MINTFFKIKYPFMHTQQMLTDNSIVLLPKAAHKYSLIWMHGLGDSSMGFLDLFKELPVVKAETKILLLQAPIRPVSINMGMKMSSWFDIKVLKSDPNMSFDNFKETVSMDEIEESKKIITNYVEQEIKLIQAKNVFIGGFSQGCCMALEVALSYPEPLGGIIGLSGYLFPTTTMVEAQASTPLLLIHGKNDQMIPCQLSQKSYERLDNKKRQIFEHKIFNNMQHEVPMPVVQKMAEIFKMIQL